MSGEPTGQQPSDAERITNLEHSLSFVERQYEELNEVVIQLRAGMLRMKELVDRLQREVDAVSQQDSTNEKPPHY